MKQLAIHDYRNAAITIAALFGLIFASNAQANRLLESRNPKQREYFSISDIYPESPILYYPKARGSASNATMFQFIAGRALHGLEPAARVPIIKAWLAENPSLKLPLGSYQNPYWIPQVTSFNYDAGRALIKSVPDYSWYDCNWSVQQKLP